MQQVEREKANAARQEHFAALRCWRMASRSGGPAVHHRRRPRADATPLPPRERRSAVPDEAACSLGRSEVRALIAQVQADMHFSEQAWSKRWRMQDATTLRRAQQVLQASRKGSQDKFQRHQDQPQPQPRPRAEWSPLAQAVQACTCVATALHHGPVLASQACLRRARPSLLRHVLGWVHPRPSGWWRCFVPASGQCRRAPAFPASAHSP